MDEPQAMEVIKDIIHSNLGGTIVYINDNVTDEQEGAMEYLEIEWDFVFSPITQEEITQEEIV